MGPIRYEPEATQSDLLSLLKSWGGDWMWEEVEIMGSLDVIISAIQSGKAIWCTDGSFDRLALPDVSSAGWVVFDPETKHHIMGSFYEVSGATAGSYRGELLGLAALHLLAVAIVELFGDIPIKNKLYCDNERALAKAKLFRRRIPPASKHGDILRLLRNIRPLLMQVFEYNHVYGHAEKHKHKSEFTLVESLNSYCDHLACLGRQRAIGSTRDITTQLLPREKIALFLDAQKQTSDISDPARYFISKANAQKFYIEELGWTSEQFEAVDWDALHWTLSKKKLMYSLWLSKQASKFCELEFRLHV
jgi:hypothetical protein